MSALLQHSAPLSGRVTVLFAILVAHVLIIQVLMRHAVNRFEAASPDAIEVQLLAPPRVHDDLPLPPKPLLRPLQFELEPPQLPEFVVVDDAASLSLARAGTGAVAEPGGGAPQARQVVVPVRYEILRPVDDFYSRQSIRAGEEGTTAIGACVRPDGTLVEAPSVLVSSGHPRLDAAAVQWAQHAVRYRPATRDGRAVESCQGFRVSFQLRRTG